MANGGGAEPHTLLFQATGMSLPHAGDEDVTSSGVVTSRAKGCVFRS